MMFLVDANVLIEAKNRYYAFDSAPGFWAWLDQAHAESVACSIDAIRDELVEGTDELADWAVSNREFFRPIDQGTTEHFGLISGWANSQDFTRAAIAEFGSNAADFLLVAYARQHRHTVVTHERSRPHARARIPIPNVCDAMGVPTVDTFQMLRSAGARRELS